VGAEDFDCPVIIRLGICSELAVFWASRTPRLAMLVLRDWAKDH
jgi:hypothetical protein